MAAGRAYQWRPLTALLVRLAVGGTFAYAGLAKAYDPAAFAADIDHYALPIPRLLTVALALYLPWLELACGLCLVFGRLMSGALALLSALIVAFVVVQLSAWYRGLDPSCGCFGSNAASTTYTWLIGRDFLLAAAVATCWMIHPASPTRGAQVPPPASNAG